METTTKSSYTVRFADCDPFGHLNNSKYVDYILNAREDQLKEHYNIDFKEYHSRGLAWVVAGHEIKYLKPALYNEVVTIQTRLINISESLLQVEAVMYDKNEVQIKAVMWSSFVPVNTKTGKREQHPDFFMQLATQMHDKTVSVEEGLKARIAVLQKQLQPVM